MGDLGAEVVKVEQPGVGDDTRGWGPPFAGGESAYFLCTNRNKKSLTVDFKSADGIALVRQLAERADVLIENFRPGAMDRLGLGEKELRETNPRLVYASLSGFGADGPMADIPGYDLIVQAWGGLMSVTGTAESGPLKVGVAIIDLVAGLMLGKSIVAALYAREKIGVGQKIDTSLLEAEVAALINAGSNYLIGGKVPGRWGNAHPTIVPYQSFQTADSFLVLGAASEAIWKRLCPALGRGRARRRSALRQKRRPRRESTRTDRHARRNISDPHDGRHGSPRSPKPTSPARRCKPSIKFLPRRKCCTATCWWRVDHPTAGTVKLAGIPVKFSATPASVRLPPPLLGQHSEDVLSSWLGMSIEEIEQLKRKSVL